jgi:transposase-like protein
LKQSRFLFIKFEIIFLFGERSVIQNFIILLPKKTKKQKKHFIMKTTIKDIAKALGVSIATVSRALTGSYEVNPETKEK